MRCLLIPLVAVFATLATAADQDKLDLILKKIAALEEKVGQQQQKIEEQQQTIQALKSGFAATSPQVVTQINSPGTEGMITQAVDKAVEARLAAIEKKARISLSPHIDNVKINGDLTFRYEMLDVDSDSSSDSKQDRYRLRLRLGGLWSSQAENWEVGLGLATGSNGRSTFDDWNNNTTFGRHGIGLDYAYAKHSWRDMTFTFGQMKNPFKTTHILWDSDLRPAGAAVAGNYDLNNIKLFGTLGAFNIRYSGTDEDLADMVAVQGGISGNFNEKTSGTLALSYYHYDTATSDAVFSDPDDEGYSWELLDLYGELKTKLGSTSLTFYGEYVFNLGADSEQSQTLSSLSSGTTLANLKATGYDPEDEASAWVLGLKAKYKRLSLNYSYVYIEGESVPAFQTDATFASGLADTNVKGHLIKLSYDFTKHFSVGANALLADWIEDQSDLDGGKDKSNIYQLDMSYKF